MSIIRLRSGTLEFRETFVLVNNEPMTYTDFLVELIDTYYRLDLSHERGSAGWFHGLTGINLSVGCPLCDSPGRITACPQCSIGRCARCARTHDRSSLCRLTHEAAVTHCAMRDSTEVDASDFYFARRVMASSVLQRSRH